ncbi:hypothetical protein B0T16DRAFT_418418 [Cercophora newfieldiana]|uniref:Uncharacterized protein n=1 Tax=Cercophora newfieldiana TaxID=92897 RepID=A0AA39XV02_9PEZI|nr:hypothetical protein B0T16DRAFT_418418 [Cercophora newfieldiana]
MISIGDLICTCSSEAEGIMKGVFYSALAFQVLELAIIPVYVVHRLDRRLRPTFGALAWVGLVVYFLALLLVVASRVEASMRFVDRLSISTLVFRRSFWK